MELDVNGLILLVGASVSGVVAIIKIVQNSKCTTIDCCCIKCKRDLKANPTPPSPPQKAEVVDI
jgi:hypothetical protein